LCIGNKTDKKEKAGGGLLLMGKGIVSWLDIEAVSTFII